MDEKIEPTDAMVDEAANALALETSGTALHLQSDAAKHTYRHRARVALRVVLNHPGAAGPFAADAARPWAPLNEGDPLHVGDEVRQDWYGVTRGGIVGRVDGNGDPWTAEGGYIGPILGGTWYVRRRIPAPTPPAVEVELPTEFGAVILNPRWGVRSYTRAVHLGEGVWAAEVTPGADVYTHLARDLRSATLPDGTRARRAGDHEDGTPRFVKVREGEK